MSERLKQVELDPGLARAYAATFIPRWDRYPLQRPDGRYTQIKEALTLEFVMAHLTGHYTDGAPVTLGAYALDARSRARWICLDADNDAQWAGLWRMAHALTENGITSYAEPSRRGGHLWLFTPTMPGADARRFGKGLLAMHDLSDMEIELYPKQDKLIDGPGSFMRLPLGVHRKTDKVYPFVNLTGDPLAATLREQLRLLVDPARVPQDFIDQLLAQTPPTREQQPTPRFTPAPGSSGETLSETLKRRISVYDFVSQYVELDRQGRAHCPFHDDQVKSFQVNIERNYWNCYANCGGGSIIDFHSKWREAHGQDGTFTATITELADMLL